MNLNHRKSLTLLELLIAIVLLTVIVIGFFNIEYFAKSQVIYADRRIKIHNDATVLLEHMTKNISQAIGNIIQDGINANDINNVFDAVTGINGDTGIIVYADGPLGALDGRRTANPPDYNLAYRFRNNSAPPLERYQVWYYPSYVSAGAHGPYEIVATRVRNIAFTTNANNNYIDVNVTFCWDPTDLVDGVCGVSPSNPQENLSTSVVLPMVSVR